MIFGAFSKNSKQLAAWARIDVKEKFIGLTSQKANPEFEKLQVNAALVNGILEYFKDDLANGKYICDGERNIYHTTHFQKYLEKYFCFRKAYCHLNLMYTPHTYIHTYIHTNPISVQTDFAPIAVWQHKENQWRIDNGGNSTNTKIFNTKKQ